MATTTEGVVIDISQMCKAGFAGDDGPRAVFPAIVGRPRYPNIQGMKRKDHYVGDEAQSKRGILTMRQPLAEDGTIENWDDMEAILHHAFYNELRVSSEEYPVLIAEPLVIPGSAREKLTQMMFEVFNVPAYLPSSPAPLALFCSGRTTGVVLDCGYHGNAAVAVQEGRPLWETYSRSMMGGQELTRNVVSVTLFNSGMSWTSQASEWDVPRDIKEKTCMLSPSPLGKSADTNLHLWRELRASRAYCADAGKDSYLAVLSADVRFTLHKYSLGTGVRYELPDGQVIYLQNDTVRIPEPLFEPSICGRETPGITSLVMNACSRSCSATLDMHKTILLSGGTTLLTGFADRLRHELTAYKPDCQVIVLPEAKNATWIGGSVAASLSDFMACAIKKREYDEEGPSVVRKKCLSNLGKTLT